MGTKNNPGKYDCYDNAEPDEPMFTLLGRDKHAPVLVDLWASMREMQGEDREKVREARDCAVSMRQYRVSRHQSRETISLDREDQPKNMSEDIEAALRELPHFEGDTKPITPEAIRKVAGEYISMITDPGPEEMVFVDQDGTERKIVHVEGDYDDGWTIPDDADWAVEQLVGNSPTHAIVDEE